MNDRVSTDVFPPADVNVSVSRSKKQSSKSTPVSSTIGAGAANSSNTPSNSRKRKLNKTNLASTFKDMGRWKPMDDLLLIQGVLQVRKTRHCSNYVPQIYNVFIFNSHFYVKTCDLRAVYQGVKFSCKFTFNELTQRWCALIYDRTISRLALSAIRNLQAEAIAHVESNCLYSEAEEEVVASIKSVSKIRQS